MTRARIALGLTLAALTLTGCTGTTTTAAEPNNPAPTASNGKPLDKGWVLDSAKISKSISGDFEGTARITNTNSEAQTATFTITLLKGTEQVASLQGVANDAAAGRTVTVQLISTDKYVPGDLTQQFQVDAAF